MKDEPLENKQPLSEEDIIVLADFFTVLIEIEQDLNKKVSR